MDSPRRPCLPSYPCLTALVCDLQSMLHRPLPHFTVITNKHHAQSLRLLFCLLRCQFLTVRPKSGRSKEVPWPPFSHKGPTGWKEKGQDGGGTIFPGSPTPAPSCLEGNVQQHIQDLLGGGEEDESQPYTFPASGQRP